MINKKVVKILIYLSLFFFTNQLGNAVEKQVKWKGEIKNDQGIREVINKVNPAYGNFTFHLKKDLSLNCGRDKDDIFEWISKIGLDNKENIYVLDSNKCVLQVFDKNGIFLKNLGRKGQGPGELQEPMDFIIDKKGQIFILDQDRIHIFNSNGKFDHYLKLNVSSTDFYVNSKEEIIICFKSFAGNKQESFVSLFSPDLKANKKLMGFFEGALVQEESNGKRMRFFIEHIYTPGLCFAKGYNNTFSFAYSMNYIIYLYDSTGVPVLKILKNEKSQSVSNEEKEHIYNQFAPEYEKTWSKAILKKAMQFPEYRPFFNHIILDEKGRLFVARINSVTSQKKNNEVDFDVFNKEGYFIYKVKLPFVPEIINNGSLYVIDEDDDTGDISVMRYNINNWNQLKDDIPLGKD